MPTLKKSTTFNFSKKMKMKLVERKADTKLRGSKGRKKLMGWERRILARSGQWELIVHNIQMSSNMLELLSKGNGSQVWAYGGDNKVVLKVVGKQHPKEQGHLRNEFQMLQEVHHRNVVQALRYRENVAFQGNKNAKQPLSAKNILVLEHANKATLLQYLKTADLSQRREAFRQIASGLAYLHCNGIVHRDLKLQNILVFEEANSTTFKISDFGFSCHLPLLSSEYKGTKKGYMAPEIHRCRTDKSVLYDPTKTDIFALGVILFALVFNHLPFEYAEETNSLYKMIKEKQFQDFWEHHKSTRFEDEPEYRIEQLKDLFERLVAFKPEGRPTMQEILKHEWLSK